MHGDGLDEAMVLGIPFMDDEHRIILEMISDIHLGGLSHEEIRQTYSNLMISVIEHFNHEEREMVSSGYPDMASHKSSHSGFLTHLDRISDLLYQDNLGEDDLHIVEFMLGWLKMHVATTDHFLAAHLRDFNGSGVQAR